MTPAARVQAALELCARIEAEKIGADAVIEGYFRSRRYAGAKDRRAVADRVYDLLRRRARLDWWIAQTRDDHPPSDFGRARMIAAVVLADSASENAVAELFNGSRHCPAALDDRERTLVNALCGRSLDDAAMPDWVRLEVPEWMWPELRGTWGDRLPAEAAALNHPAPLDLRVNTLRASRDEARRSLSADGIDAEPTPISPVGLRVPRARVRIGGTAAFRNGLVEVQDEGSQIIALLTDARPGMTLVDFCAGAGGKTLALAASIGEANGEESGGVIACDISARHMQRMTVRLRRAGTRNVHRRVLASERDPWIAENAGSADRVLLDVPCTGTGTWRRHPEAKWRLTPGGARAAVERQRQIVLSACRLVKPGGRLIYATCSLLPGENERQVDWLLARRPEFTPIPVGEVWAETLGGPCPASGSVLRLSPVSTGTDGFFAAVFKRRAEFPAQA